MDFGGIRDFYFSLEDKYYDLLDSLDKHIPIYKIVDPIDKIFPSFVIVLAVFFLVLFGILFVVVANNAAPVSTLGIIKVTDNQGQTLRGIALSVHLEQNPVALQVVTNESGLAKFDLGKPAANALLSVHNVSGFLDFEETVSLQANQVKEIQLESAPSAQFETTFVIRFKDSQSRDLITGQTVTVSFSCGQTPGNAPSPQTTTAAQVSVSKNASCGTLFASAQATQGYVPASAPILESPQDLFLEPVAIPASGTLEVTVLDANHQPVSKATVRIGTKQEAELYRGSTNATGLVSFDLAPKTYAVRAEKEGRTAEKESTVQSGQTTRIELNIGNTTGTEKKILLRLVDRMTKTPVELASVSFYRNSFLLDEKFSGQNGLVEKTVVPGKEIVFSAVIFHGQYLLHVLPDIVLRNLNDQNALTVELEPVSNNPANYGQARAIVSSDKERFVKGARTYLYRTDYQNPLRRIDTDTQGEALFGNLPETTNFLYFAKAFHSEGVSEQKPVATGQTVDFPIRLVFGKGRFVVPVKDYATNQALSGAAVTAFRWKNDQRETLDTNRTNTNGEYTSAELQSEQTVFFEITKDGYLPQTTSGYGVLEDTNRKIPSVRLVPVSYSDQNIFVLYEHLLELDGSIAVQLHADHNYWAVFLLNLPLNTTYNNPVSHVDAGVHDADHNQAEQNPEFVSNALGFPYNGNSIGFSRDMNIENLFSDPTPVSSGTPAKQVNIRRSSLPQGTVEFRTKLSIRKNTPAHTDIFLYHQAQAQAPVETIVSPLEVVHFAVDEIVCSTDCPAFYWQAFLSETGQNNFRPVTSNPRLSLVEDQNYDIQYQIYNLSNTTFSSDLNFSTNPTYFSILGGNGFLDQSFPPGLLRYGLSNPLQIRALRAQNPASIQGTLYATPESPDSSNEYTVFFNIAGGKPLRLTPQFSSNPDQLWITVRDDQTNRPLEGVKVEIQKDCGPVTQEELDQFVFNSPPNSENDYHTAPTDSNGMVLFDNQSLDASECMVMRASNVPGYAIRTIRKTASDSTPRFNPAFECIKIDMDPSTPTVEDQLPAQHRNTSFYIKIVSAHCQGATVCLHTLDSAPYDMISTDPFQQEIWFTQENGNSKLPAAFQLDTDQNKTVQVHIGNNAPLGFIPFITYVNSFGEQSCGLDSYSSLGETMVLPRLSPNLEGMGSVKNQ